ncbi:unnamed protein product [Rotaria magnacalcarata]|nr:unnamed protein product [Rotaria magnacalcarata]
MGRMGWDGMGWDGMGWSHPTRSSGSEYKAGVITAAVVAPHYFKDITSLFFGSMAFGYAVEKVNLHRRIALFVLSWVGMTTKWY